MRELRNVGFGEEDVKQGRVLVLKACSTPQAAVRFTPDAGPVADATEKLLAWQSSMFLRAHAALRRLLDQLENSAARKSSRKADHAALATLETRGVTKEERKQAKHLVNLIETTAAPDITSAPPSADKRMSALMDVYEWVQDWSDSARAVITRRDQLIRLGIGKRQTRAVPVDPQPAASPAPPPALPTITIAALPPKSNGVPSGAMVLAADGGAHA